MVAVDRARAAGPGEAPGAIPVGVRHAVGVHHQHKHRRPGPVGQVAVERLDAGGAVALVAIAIAVVHGLRGTEERRVRRLAGLRAQPRADVAALDHVDRRADADQQQ